MADNTAIEWTDASWTPIRARNLATGKVGWHCVHESEGCRFCYAEAMNRWRGTGLPFKPGLLARAPLLPSREKLSAERTDEGRPAIELFLDDELLLQPLRWKRPRRIFACSMTDLFADFVPDAMIDQIFAIMALSPHHTFQVLTKRASRMREYVTGLDETHRRSQIMIHLLDLETAGAIDKATLRAVLSRLVSTHWPLENVWLGVSAERQAEADRRIPELLSTPAALRFVSYEPALGPIDFTPWLARTPSPLAGEGGPSLCEGSDEGEASAGATYRRRPPHQSASADSFPRGGGSGSPALDWIIYGGESGPKARIHLRAWARSTRDQCAAAGTAFLLKQHGEWIDADEWLDHLERGPAVILDDGKPWHPARPLNFADAAILADMFGDRCEHQVDGTTLIRVGKRRAGRLLDGIEHNAFPAAMRAPASPLEGEAVRGAD